MLQSPFRDRSLTLGEALKRRQRLAAVALLNTDVDVVLSRLLLWLLLGLVDNGLLISTMLLFARVREGVCNKWKKEAK